MAIRCRICTQKFQRISVSHLRTHDLTMREYRQRFPQAPLYSTAALAKHKASMQAEFRKPERRAQITRAAQYQRTAEGRRRASKHFRRLWQCEDYRKARVEERLRMWQDPKHRSRLSRKTKETWQELDIRERRITALRAALSTDEYRQAAGERSEKRWKDPEERAKIMRGICTAENLLRQSEASKRMWEDPTIRVRLLTTRAKRRRKKWTLPERIVRSWLKQLGVYFRTGGEFHPHKIVNGHEVDFFGYNIIIQVDGNWWHGPNFPEAQRRDAEQNVDLRSSGFLVYRMRESDIKQQPDLLIKNLKQLLVDQQISFRNIAVNPRLPHKR